MSGLSIVQTGPECEIAVHDALGRRRAGLALANVPQILCRRRGWLELPNLWLIAQALQKPGRAAIRNEATAVRAFIEHIDDLGLDFEMVGDATITAWRARLKLGDRKRDPKGRGAKAHRARKDLRSNGHVSAYVKTVWDMYRWLERKGHVTGVVQTDEGNANGAGITIGINKVRRANGDVDLRPYCPLLLAKERVATRATPDAQQIEDVHAQLTGREAERNAIILLLPEQSGARRGDLLQLRTGDVPSRDEIDEHLESLRIFGTEVVGKNKVRRRLNTPIHLAIMQRNYMDGPRAAAVHRAKKRNPAYAEPPELILSERGTPLSPTWTSNLVTQMFQRAGVRNAGLHRLRATFLTRIAAAFVAYRTRDGSPLPLPTIQLIIQEIAGWTTLSALPSYIADAHRVVGQTDHAPEFTSEVEAIVEQLLGAPSHAVAHLG